MVDKVIYEAPEADDKCVTYIVQRCGLDGEWDDYSEFSNIWDATSSAHSLSGMWDEGYRVVARSGS